MEELPDLGEEGEKGRKRRDGTCRRGRIGKEGKGRKEGKGGRKRQTEVGNERNAEQWVGEQTLSSQSFEYLHNP